MAESLKNIMAQNVVSISSEATIQEAASLMSQHNVGSIPVVDGGQIKGIITDRDITLRSTSQGLPATTSVSQVMSSNLVTGTPDMDIHEAANIMAQQQIRRLPVVENNQIVGMVALGDLATKNIYQNEAGEALSSISVPSRTQ
ncbi:CBS domain-containing protein [Lottiidibacillus patelloidae]|uniref:CBS domain-containing protein n=1 Tax=Lottiidibacillus patelloidae TaxID=2670334 RepID=A0A263BWG7_9BACI|nr:CBS domain-containing protein [Lottiidibacillus patelloidae]OZM58055.1 CBS domain-containing protein [Lottiidibacillus patelloidae]